MSLNFVGRRFGKYTILRFTGTQYECSCMCGRIEYVGIGLPKPTYRGRRMCAFCAGSPCEMCGTIIPAKPGHPSATCSEACAKQHIKNRGRKYYERVKKTPEYQEMHARAVESLKNRKQSDPEYAEIWLAYYRHMNFLSRERIKQNPAMRENYLEMKRESYRAWRQRIEAEPMGWEVLKRKSRLWYQALRPGDKERIYIKPARDKRKEFI